MTIWHTTDDGRREVNGSCAGGKAQGKKLKPKELGIIQRIALSDIRSISCKVSNGCHQTSRPLPSAVRLVPSAIWYLHQSLGGHDLSPCAGRPIQRVFPDVPDAGHLVVEFSFGVHHLLLVSKPLVFF